MFVRIYFNTTYKLLSFRMAEVTKGSLCYKGYNICVFNKILYVYICNDLTRIVRMLIYNVIVVTCCQKPLSTADKVNDTIYQVKYGTP